MLKSHNFAKFVKSIDLTHILLQIVVILATLKSWFYNNLQFFKYKLDKYLYSCTDVEINN